MCGRFTLIASTDDLARLFDCEPLIEAAPRYNIAPTQPVSIIRSHVSHEKPVLDQARWGLIPHWAKDERIGQRLINARAETLSEKPSFKTAYKKRRCLIPTDGFYEWRKQGSGKAPYLIKMKTSQPFAFAGLWETWCPEPDREIVSCTIITTEPNELMESIHHRMPVILPLEKVPQWLDPTAQSPDTLQSLLVPCSSDAMTLYPVSSAVNNPQNDSPECMEPLQDLFA